MKSITHRITATAILGMALAASPQYTFAFSGQDKVKDAAVEVGDKAEDAKDQTVKAANEVGDKAEDAKDQTVKGAKKSGNWLKRGFHKIGDWFS